MKTIVAIMWHGHYNILSNIKSKLEKYLNIKIYDILSQLM